MSKRAKDIQSGLYTRLMKFEPAVMDGDNVVIPASLSSEEPVERWFGKEVLSHEAGAADLSRAIDGLPLLWNHDSNEPIGKVHNVRLEGGRLRGDLVFHDITERARNAAAMAKDRWIDGVSIGYRIKQWVEDKGSDVIRATKWALYEASVAPVPADGSVGAYRSEDLAMPEIHDGSPVQTDGQSTVVDASSKLKEVSREYKVARLEGAREAVATERRRISDLDDLFGMAIIPDNDFYRALRVQAIDEGWPVEDTRKLVLDALSGEAVPAFDHRTVVDKKPAMPARQPGQPQSQSYGSVQSVADEMDKFRDIAVDTILVRSGVELDRDVIRKVRDSGLREFSLRKLGEEWLAMKNVSTRGLSDEAIAGRLLTRDHTHSDFTSILANVANKAALAGWTQANTTWQEWCNIGSLPDFKQATIAGLGAFPDLDKIPSSGGPYKMKSMEDIHETATIETYGALFGVSRRALQDDDLMALTRAPQKLGDAAARKVNSLAYAVIASTGQTMTEDSTALFDVSTHANYVASSGAAPSTTTLDTAFAAMMKQKAPLRSGDTSTPYLNIRPQYLLVPPELMGVAETIAQAQYDPNSGTTTKNQFNPNRYQGRLSVVAEALMAATSTTAWVLAAPKGGSVDTVTMFFLDGRQEPYLEEATNIQHDGVMWKVRIDAVARALDWRGMYKNAGT